MSLFCFFFFNDPATTEIYTLSLHDALPILRVRPNVRGNLQRRFKYIMVDEFQDTNHAQFELELGMIGVLERSEEHTSELQSLTNLVCRLLLEKKKKNKNKSRDKDHNNVQTT